MKKEGVERLLPSPHHRHRVRKARADAPACASHTHFTAHISGSFLFGIPLLSPWPSCKRALLQSGDSQVITCLRVGRVTRQGGDRRGGGGDGDGGWVAAGAARLACPEMLWGAVAPSSRRCRSQSLRSLSVSFPRSLAPAWCPHSRPLRPYSTPFPSPTPILSLCVCAL